MYGGFVLRLYDHDMRGALPAVYDGKLRKIIFDKPIKAPVATGTGAAAGSTNVQDQDTRLIAKLRNHLWTLGFWVFPRVKDKTGVVGPEPSDAFDWRTEWAVREFQIAAAMPNVAVQDVKKKPTEDECKTKGKYLATLSAKKNDKILGEHPSGVVTGRTAETIKYWLDHHYRCPVVIQAMHEVLEVQPAPKGKKPKKKKVLVVHTENLWRHDEVVQSGTRMYAWDLSGHYQFSAGHSNEAVYVGRYYRKNPPFGGPISNLPESWTEARLSPESWQGQTWSEMDSKHKSTWRAIMAVAAQECGGGLDIVNFWDNCLGSAGHFHWTMPKSDCSSGEFCGFMALLESKYPDAFDKCFAKFGIWGPRWTDPSAQGRPKVVHAPVVGGYIYTKDDQGRFSPHPAAGGFAEAAWLRSWQAAYRLEMAARTCKEYRETMWEYAKYRLDSMRGLSEADGWLATGSKAGKPKITLGSIFTSERGIALALRLHVWRPAFLMVTKKKKNVEPILHDALLELIRNGTLTDDDGKELAPADWTDEHEKALVDVMVRLIGERCKSGAKASMQRARYWPLQVSTKDPFGPVLAKVGKTETPVLQRFAWIPRNALVDEVAPSENRDSLELSD